MNISLMIKLKLSIKTVLTAKDIRDLRKAEDEIRKLNEIRWMRHFSNSFKRPIMRETFWAQYYDLFKFIRDLCIMNAWKSGKKR